MIDKQKGIVFEMGRVVGFFLIFAMKGASYAVGALIVLDIWGVI